MRKLWLVLFAACTFAGMSACSDEGDDTKKPVNPVSEVKIPATAEIGSTVEITGKGFSNNAQIVLKSSTGTQTGVENLEVSAASVKFNIPATLTSGVYTIVLKQDGTWDLGSVRLIMPDMPILDLTLPEAIKLNKPLEIGGIGFTAASKIYLETADAAKTRTELTVTPGPAGVSCVIPGTVKAGAYNVVLKHNNIDWTLGEKIEAAVYKQFKGYKVTVAETYGELTPAIIKKAIAALMGATEEDITDELLEAYTPMIEGMFKSETSAQSMMKAFDAQDRVTAMKSQVDDKPATDFYTFTYENDKITATNGEFKEGYDMTKTIIWTVADGRVTEAEVTTNNLNNYIWIYDDAGRHTSVKKGSAVYRGFIYTEGNFTGVMAEGNSTTVFEYKDATKKNNIFGIDVAKLLLSASKELKVYGAFEHQTLHASYLGIDGKASANLPTAFLPGKDAQPLTLTYTLDADGYAASVKWAISGMDSMIGLVSYENATTVEFVYE